MKPTKKTIKKAIEAATWFDGFKKRQPDTKKIARHFGMNADELEQMKRSWDQR